MMFRRNFFFKFAILNLLSLRVYCLLILRVTSEYQSFHYMKPEIITKRMVGECSSSVTDTVIVVY